MGRYRMLILFALVLGGCGSQDAILKKQAEFEARLEQVVQVQATTNARLTEFFTMLTDVQAQLKTQGLEVEQLKPGYRELKTSLENTSLKLEKLASEAAAKPAKVESSPPLTAEEPGTAPPALLIPQPELIKPVVPPATDATLAAAVPEPVKHLDAHDAYQKAFRLYMADKYTESLAAFEAFLAENPSHDYAANAQYWIGECLYSLKNFEWAINAFNKVVTQHPTSGKVPDAMLKSAFSLFNLGRGDKAREMLHRLVEGYPRSAAASKARERLAKERRK